MSISITFSSKAKGTHFFEIMPKIVDINTYALGYDPVKHISASFVQRIEASCYNLLGGIPIETIVEMLKEIGYKEDNF